MKNRLALSSLIVLLCILGLTDTCSGHDISIFDVGTRITVWVTRKKVQLGFLVELKNFPGQDCRIACDLNKDMKIDDDEREHYIKVHCKRFIDNIHLEINGREVAKTITKTDVYGFVGDVSRDPFSTYIEAETPLDRSLYRVKIEYTNDNFLNEEPQIINDVNISVSKELDNLDIYPITPIVQYMDRELPDHLFMEMTLDRHFFIDFGYKDVGESREPFTANEIMLTKDSGQTSRQAKSGTPAPGTSGSTKTLYKWLSDFTMDNVESKMKATGASAWLWLVIIGIFVGLVHVLIPGHGKGVIASYVVATHSRPARAVQLALMITLVHTLSTIVLAAFIMVLAEVYLPTTVQNVAVIYLTLVSGGLITLIGLYMLFFFNPLKWTKEEEKEKKLVEETLESGEAKKSRFSLMWKVAVATGIIPCITSSYAATLFIAYREYSKAFLMILFIAIGQAITLSVIGAVASGFFKGLRWIASKEKGGFFTALVGYVHKPTAVILILCGLYGVYLGWGFFSAAKASVQPMTANERIAAYEESLKKDRDDFDAHFNLGLLYAAKGELDRALDHFRKASVLKDDADSLRFAGHALARQKKFEDALKLYEQGLEARPGDVNLLFNAAYTHGELGDIEQAATYYRKAAELGEPMASFNLAVMNEKQTRLDEALMHYLKAAEGRPEDLRIQLAIANVYRNKKEYEKAAGYLLTVHGKNPDSRQVNLALANIYLRRLEDSDAAQPYLEAYLEQGGREEILAALKELEGQRLLLPSYQKWSAPEAAEKFGKFGSCAVPFLEKLTGKQEGEDLKVTLAALAATEAPQALPCIISVLNDNQRWSDEDLFADYGSEIGSPPVPVVAKEAFLKCMRKSCLPLVVPELVKVAGEANNREYFLKQLFFDSCVEYPFVFMDTLLAYAGTANKDSLVRAVEIVLSLKGEVLSMADDTETLRAFLSYLCKWWKDNRESLTWDKSNYYFHKKE